jgi:hypothetical protein
VLDDGGVEEGIREPRTGEELRSQWPHQEQRCQEKQDSRHHALVVLTPECRLDIVIRNPMRRTGSCVGGGSRHSLRRRIRVAWIVERPRPASQAACSSAVRFFTTSGPSGTPGGRLWKRTAHANRRRRGVLRVPVTHRHPATRVPHSLPRSSRPEPVGRDASGVASGEPVFQIANTNGRTKPRVTASEASACPARARPRRSRVRAHVWLMR